MGNICCGKNAQLESRVLHAGNFKVLKQVDNIEDKYQLGEELGKGAFGLVRKCILKGPNEIVAMKIVDKNSFYGGDREKTKHIINAILSELKHLQTLNHINIMQAKEILEDEDNFYIVTELLEGGELFDKILEIN